MEAADLPYVQLPSTNCTCIHCQRKEGVGDRSRGRKVVFGRGWLRLLAAFHLLSLLVFACCICSAKSSSQTSIINATQPTTTSDVYLEENVDCTSYSLIDNPLLRHQRKTPETQCHIWNSNSPADLCSRGRWARLRWMRDISLFSKDCTSEVSNVRLAELFRLEWRYIKSEADLLSHTEQLLPFGKDCVLGAPQSSQCLACFGRIDESLKQVERAYKAFDRTLQRFDCMLAVDSSSATRPFSPNGTCLDCKTWYRKWLLVQLVGIWLEPPCINWCYYTQLACPHLATSKVVDFAGHPAFQCRDLHIPQSTSTGSSQEPNKSCQCIHPCDLLHLPPSQPTTSPPANTKSSQPHDFFAAPEHCQSRQDRCRRERLQKQSEHAAYPTGATHQKAAYMAVQTSRTGRSAEEKSGLHDQRRKHRHQGEEKEQMNPSTAKKQLDYKKFRRRSARNGGGCNHFGTMFIPFVLFVLKSLCNSIVV